VCHHGGPHGLGNLQDQYHLYLNCNLFLSLLLLHIKQEPLAKEHHKLQAIAGPYSNGCSSVSFGTNLLLFHITFPNLVPLTTSAAHQCHHEFFIMDLDSVPSPRDKMLTFLQHQLLQVLGVNGRSFIHTMVCMHTDHPVQ
jgi:hypothetical protein